MLEKIQKLQSLLPKLKPHDAEFADDLIAAYHKYGKLTPGQAPWINILIERAEKPVEQKEQVKVDVGGFEGVIALFNKAKEKLKYPKINLIIVTTSENGLSTLHTVILSLNGPNAKNPGWVNVSGEGTYPNKMWYGRVSPTGVFYLSNKTESKPEFLKKLKELLSDLVKDPAGIAKEHGKLSGCCCFCNSELTDKRSLAAGFGPVCAKHYGLETQWKEAVLKYLPLDGDKFASNYMVQAKTLADQFVQDSMAKKFKKFKEGSTASIKFIPNEVGVSLNDFKWGSKEIDPPEELAQHLPMGETVSFQSAALLEKLKLVNPQFSHGPTNIDGNQVCVEVVEKVKPRPLYACWQE